MLDAARRTTARKCLRVLAGGLTASFDSLMREEEDKAASRALDHGTGMSQSIMYSHTQSHSSEDRTQAFDEGYPTKHDATEAS
jgi:hypothetical protein